MKIKLGDVFSILKDIFVKMCVYFTFMALAMNSVAWFFNQVLNYSAYFMLVASALWAGAASQVYKIQKLPQISRHIAFFILLYLDFLLIFMPLSSYTVTQNTTLVLSAAFVVAYLIIFGLVMGTRAIVRLVKNRRSAYEKQFKNL